uniref:Uncharacterized protein n=1 Tax=Oryza brachyantha TaxID=4533 RepID=J3MTC0_ORYBR
MLKYQAPLFRRRAGLCRRGDLQPALPPPRRHRRPAWWRNASAVKIAGGGGGGVELELRAAGYMSTARRWRRSSCWVLSGWGDFAVYFRNAVAKEDDDDVPSEIEVITDDDFLIQPMVDYHSYAATIP